MDDRYARDREYGRRDLMDRAGDEVRSWFGDDEAQRRRRMDEMSDPDRDRFDRDRWERDRWSSRSRYGARDRSFGDDRDVRPGAGGPVHAWMSRNWPASTPAIPWSERRA